MTPDQSRSQLGAKVPTNQKDALVKWAHEQSSAYNSVSLSDHVREAISEYLNQHWDEMPEDARADLDRASLSDPNDVAVEANGGDSS